MTIKKDSEIAEMRIAGKMLAKVLELMKEKAVPGVTPRELDRIAAEETKRLGGKPSFLGYEGFPCVICISVNDQVQHSIPSNVPLELGDIVNFDFGVTYNGMITDSGITICVGGEPTRDQQRLLSGTEEALNAALKVVKAGRKVGDISATIEAVLKKHKLGIVRELVGHGVGYELHEDPEIPNYGKAGIGPVLKAGMTIAIEPITTLGSADIYQEKDGWTLRTYDGSLSAQFEHTVLVTETGCEVITKL